MVNISSTLISNTTFNLVSSMTKQKKSPLKAKPLRNPGQSLDEEINKLIDDKGTDYAVITIFPIVLAVLEWYRWYMEMSYTPWLYTIIAFICSFYGFYKLFKLKSQVKNLKLGRDGEKAVGQYLELLRESGTKIFHDIVGESFNIDHVVISTKGIFTVETKTYSKPMKGKPEIQHYKTKLIINGFESTSDILTQAKAQANWLTFLLQELTGKSFQVKTVVAFPGWYIDCQTKDPDVWVLNPKAVPKYIENNQVKFTVEEVHFISSCLSRYIRNKESG